MCMMFKDYDQVQALADKLACGSVLPEKERDVIECQFLLVNFARVRTRSST